jgi:hypothetical protein
VRVILRRERKGVIEGGRNRYVEGEGGGRERI